MGEHGLHHLIQRQIAIVFNDMRWRLLRRIAPRPSRMLRQTVGRNATTTEVVGDDLAQRRFPGMEDPP